MDPAIPQLNNRLWITRVKRGLPRKKLANLLGHKVTSQICRWEEGQIPTLQNALIMAYLLQTPIEFLFKGLRNELIRRVEARQRTADRKVDEPLIRIDTSSTNETMKKVFIPTRR